MNLSSDQPADRGFLLWVLGVCTVLSVALSAWCIYIDDVINNDGVEYIRAAERLALGDWTGALSLYKWPFYPLLVLTVGKVAGVGYQVAGHIANSALLSAVVALFVLTVRAMGGTSRRLTLLAALVALIHPAFNEYRAFIIRDPGYLIGYLAGVYFLFRYCRCARPRYYVGMLVGFAFASLFRVEGLVFLFCSPILIVLTRTQPVRSLGLLTTFGGMVGILLTTVLGWWALALDGADTFSILSDPVQIISTAWDQIANGIIKKISILQRHFLGPFSARYSYLLFGLTVPMIIVSTTISQLTAPWFVLTVFGLRNRSRFANHIQARAWISLLLLHLMILTTFALIMLFLVDRYLLGFSITALLLVPFVLDNVLGKIRWQDFNRIKQVLIAILLLWGVGESISGLDNFTRHQHLKEAGLWLAGQTAIPGSLVSNDRRVAYYAGRHADLGNIVPSFGVLYNGLKKKRWPGAEYIAVVCNRSLCQKITKHFKKVQKYNQIKVFSGRKEGKVLIYRLQS